MDFEWTIDNHYKDLPEKEYINPCCVGGDEVLAQIKTDLEQALKLDDGQSIIYQEDWGWALEFTKDNVFYLLAVNNAEVESDGKTLFCGYTSATKTERGLIFNKTIDAEQELEHFSFAVSKIAKDKGFEEK